MGFTNPLKNTWGSDTLNDLYDRRGAVTYTSASVGQGEISSNSWTTQTFPLASNGQLPGIHGVTSSSANNRGLINGDTIGPLGKLRVCSWQVKLVQTTSCRLFCVVSATQFTDGDTPTADYMGFRYSTNASDTNWQCVSNGNGAAGVTDSGVPVTTAEVLLSIVYDNVNGYIQYYINRNLVATRTTALPRTTLTTYCWRTYLTTLAAATKEVDVAFYNERYTTV